MDTPALWTLFELRDLPGVACIADDILIYGVGDTLEEATQDHYKNLTSLLEHCKEKSIRLNKEKVALRVQQLDFMGHQLTAQGLKPDQVKWKLAGNTKDQGGH